MILDDIATQSCRRVLIAAVAQIQVGDNGAYFHHLDLRLPGAHRSYLGCHQYFDTLETLSRLSREKYGFAGAVQHGASTLPDTLFHRFPEVDTAEIHLATGFQNALYEHPAFPESLHREIEAWCFANALDERKAGQTDQQFVYTTRKKAIGPFKRQLWELETRDDVLADQASKVAYLFRELRVNDTREVVERHVQPIESHRPLPDALAGVVAD